MKVGDQATVTRSFDATAVAQYCAIGGGSVDGQRLPEPLVSGLFSYLLGVELPGLGTNYLKQETEWLADACLDQPLIAQVKITRLRPQQHLVDLHTTCYQGATLVASGRALVYVRDVPGLEMAD